MNMDFTTHCREIPFQHQIIGVHTLVRNPYFLLADEMGAGKTKQVIDAGQILFHLGTIDRILVIAPSPVRSVWFDPDWGELKKHLWEITNARIIEFHSTNRGWWFGNKVTGRTLQIIITNYDFIRREERLSQIKPFCNSRTLLILDESSAVKNHRADQTRSCLILRKKCGFVWMLNGTPIANNPLDLYSQGNILNPNILGCRSFTHFRSRYAVMGGWQGKEITSWVNLKDLNARFAPYILRRLKTDCLDLPPKLPPVTVTVPLTPTLWKKYQEMRDEFVSWLSKDKFSAAPEAIVKAIRLCQITSGFIGGIQEFDPEDPDGKAPVTDTAEIGSEKHDFFLRWLDQQLELDPKVKIIVWCRFRVEIERLFKSLQANKYWNLQTGRIWGNQSREDRDKALRLLDPRTMPDEPVVVLGTPGSGSLGLNLTGARIAFYLSSDYSLFKRQQADDRIHRTGQKHAVSYFDCIATGPNGQKTIDHHILKVVRGKEEIAKLTAEGWIKALTEE